MLEDGLYDRFRSNPPLDVVAQERPDIDLSWFKTIKKERKEVWLYDLLARFLLQQHKYNGDLHSRHEQDEELIPEKVRTLFQPITFSPGKGLIAITSYYCSYCDNDSYNELWISIVTTKPNSSNFGVISLMGEIREKSFWGYVLKLPVDIELARIRGVVGYNRSKCLISMDSNNDGDAVTFTFYDERGTAEFAMIGKKLDERLRRSDAAFTPQRLPALHAHLSSP